MVLFVEGSDLCRGLLMFDVAKPLGPNGLNWLKIHLANLFGHNKITHMERVAWVIKPAQEEISNPSRH